MGIRTDMAVESAEHLGENLPKGVTSEEVIIDGITLTKINIRDEDASEKLGKPIGLYTTIDASSIRRHVDGIPGEVDALAQSLAQMIPENGSVLVAGLGNSDITPDALGPKIIGQIFATRHIPAETVSQGGLDGLRDVCAIATGVLGQTGMESAEIISSICKSLNPSVVIVVDALACSSISRLGSTIQVTNTGISPGSGVQNKRKELSKESIGVPVIAIGVPTVVDMTTIAHEMFELEGSASAKEISEKGRTMMVTPREIDVIIDRAARLVALGINSALQPTLSVQDIECLVG